MLLFANQIMALPMTSLAAMLILAGYYSIKPVEISKVWRANHVSAFVMTVTLVATLYLPVFQAILLGVLIQIFGYIFQAAERVKIVQLTPTADGDFCEQAVGRKAPDGVVIMLLPYGSLFYAAARDFEEEAPEAEDAMQAAIIIVLRGRETIGSTAIGVFERYAKTLQRNGGRLFLADVSDSIRAKLEKTGVLATIGVENVLSPKDEITASLRSAYDHANTWLQRTNSASPAVNPSSEEVKMEK
ncbi:MAG: SulP family inorganic anion transporter [Caldilineaceae bacterium]|nr:SulP family inorganic anion transporter [Caldilineaceae bacterium]